MMLLRRIGSFILETLQVIVFAVSIFLFLYLLVLQPHKIKGASMEPNFQDSEYLLTDKITYRFEQPKRGDVIVFKAPPDFHDEYIKRIIGLPGDQILISKGKIYINGNLLDETYLPPEFQVTAGKAVPEGTTITVPANTYLVMGDNRDHSFDSRSFGPINKDKITGKAWVVYWPVSKLGKIKNPFN
jgi:signal peptidase I